MFTKFIKIGNNVFNPSQITSVSIHSGNKVTVCSGSDVTELKGEDAIIFLRWLHNPEVIDDIGKRLASPTP